MTISNGLHLSHTVTYLANLLSVLKKVRKLEIALGFIMELCEDDKCISNDAVLAFCKDFNKNISSDEIVLVLSAKEFIDGLNAAYNNYENGSPGEIAKKLIAETIQKCKQVNKALSDYLTGISRSDLPSDVPTDFELIKAVKLLVENLSTLNFDYPKMLSDDSKDATDRLVEFLNRDLFPHISEFKL
jgi:hypothetical protein